MPDMDGPMFPVIVQRAGSFANERKANKPTSSGGSPRNRNVAPCT